MKTMPMLEEHEVFATLIEGGRPAFWCIEGGRPVMLSYAVTSGGRDRYGDGPVCTCPSGDGSLRWPCPVHPPTVHPDGGAS